MSVRLGTDLCPDEGALGTAFKSWSNVRGPTVGRGQSAYGIKTDAAFKSHLNEMVKRDDPVAKYLPADVRVPSRNGRQITLLDLATHMSGLPRFPTGYEPPDPGNPYAQYAAEHLHAFLERYELERDPGANFEYSNLGMGCSATGSPARPGRTASRPSSPTACYARWACR